MAKAKAKKKSMNLQVSDDNVILIADASGGITLKNKSGAKITIGKDGIVLDTGKGARITLKGNKVDVNEGALEVT